MCGEKAATCRKDTPGSGSPPRVRGKANLTKNIGPELRITPACAGKSCTFWLPLRRDEDHPRVCGEKHHIRLPLMRVTGSPPRVRGKVPISVTLKPLHGITPACAGKRPVPALPPSVAWDHPRVCGEKRLIISGICGFTGSPPRVRGKGKSYAGKICHVRITPACAGKSSFPTASVPWCWDHPRVCGEKCQRGREH